MIESAPEDEFSIHWIHDVVEEVEKSKEDEYLINTGKSPSGSIHVGSIRELIIADVIKRELERKGKTARTMYIVDDYDPVRAFPPGVSLSSDQWAGIPYSDVPDQFGCCESFGAHWANELIDTFPNFGLEPEIVWQSKLYKTKEMIDAVRICLKETKAIRKIMIEYVARDFNEEQRTSYIESMRDWYPASVVCPICGRLQSGVKGTIIPNRITQYDVESDYVSFSCPACGHTDSVALDKVRVKLSWRVDWPAKWYVLNVTCEPAGKDHSVKGGSYDTGLEISRKVFGWSGPVKVPYEWVRIGGRDMSTSEGIVFTPKVWLSLAPAELYRFIMLKSSLERAINIQPERIPDLVDEYDRLERIYYGLDEADSEKRELALILYPLSESVPPKAEYIPKLPFKFSVVMSQLTELIGEETVVERSKEVLTKIMEDRDFPEATISLIHQRLEQAGNWVESYGSERDRVIVPESVSQTIIDSLTDKDKAFLKKMLQILRKGDLDEDKIQSAVFEIARDVGLKEKRAFAVTYRILISRKSGPRLGSFLNMLGYDWVANRISSVLKKGTQ